MELDCDVLVVAAAVGASPPGPYRPTSTHGWNAPGSRLDNLVAAGKCLCVTHITNGCYRLHQVEWNTGEAAGALASFSIKRGVPPRAVSAKPDLLTEFQSVLSDLGVQLHWPDDIRSQAR